MEKLTLSQLPPGWQPTSAYARGQPLGADWYRRQATAMLRVPSSSVAHEHNYVLNTRHPAFAQIRLAGWEDVAFDPRIKAPEPS